MRWFGRLWQHIVEHSVWSGVITGLTVVGVVAVGGLVWQLASEEAEARTRVIEFSAGQVDEAGAEEGECLPSLKSRRLQAFLCRVFLDREDGRFNVYDPCFPTPNLGNYVLCPNDPTVESSALVVDVRQYLELDEERGGVGRSPNAWFIVTSDGMKCDRQETANSQFYSRGRPFGCMGDRPVFCTEPVKKGEQLWTVECVDISESSEPARHEIAELYQ